jgi:hypothetical protein
MKKDWALSKARIREIYGRQTGDMTGSSLRTSVFASQ